MRAGVVFPQLEVGADPRGVVEYARAVEDAGYDHLVAYDHVVGVDKSAYPGWRGPYDSTSLFHEPFVLFGHLAAVTPRLELAPAVIVLPQRQAALVAKQAAEIDVLAAGKTRLGVGLGWNEPEYEALGMPFTNRARRLEEQVKVIRKLFTDEVVDFKGRYHTLSHVGLNPMPVQRPIPIWFGGDAEPAMKRIARLADGWFTWAQPDEKGRAQIERFRGYLREAGRDPATFPIEGRVNAFRGDERQWLETARGFRDLGMTHIEINTMRAGYDLKAHIAAIRRFKELLATL